MATETQSRLSDHLWILSADISELDAKDYLYVAFMTFTLWFITFSVLLTEEAAL